MSNRLDQEREKTLQPKRMESCRATLEDMGFEVTCSGGNRLEFEFKGERVMHYPYSGWHTGKSITDGRGFKKLLNQLKTED